MRHNFDDPDQQGFEILRSSRLVKAVSNHFPTADRYLVMYKIEAKTNICWTSCNDREIAKEVCTVEIFTMSQR